MVARYRVGGSSTWALARRFGVGRATIGRILEREGVQLRPPYVRFPVDNAEIVRLRESGHTWAEVGRKVQMSPAGVQKRYWATVTGVSSQIPEEHP